MAVFFEIWIFKWMWMKLLVIFAVTSRFKMRNTAMAVEREKGNVKITIQFNLTLGHVWNIAIVDYPNPFIHRVGQNFSITSRWYPKVWDPNWKRFNTMRSVDHFDTTQWLSFIPYDKLIIPFLSRNREIENWILIESLTSIKVTTIVTALVRSIFWFLNIYLEISLF